jgi:Glycosyl hydrolase family 81 C-terminal domain
MSRYLTTNSLHRQSKVFAESNQAAECRVADRIQAVGQVMTATELTAARTYWHVSQSPENEVKIYPSEYTPKVVGIVWEMMAQFQTWFGNRPYLMYGIQLLPITPVSELRDTTEWAKEAYPDYSQSCEATEDCTGSGWSVLQISMLATVGHPKLAMERALAMPKGNFDGAAGDGHSLSNTLWYIATRPDVAYPLRLSNATSSSDDDAFVSPSSGDEYTLTNCNRPGKCTEFVLDTIAGLYSCRQRIQWLMWQRGKTELEACATVAGVENPKECGMCNPLGGNTSSIDEPPPFTCPPCTDKQCASDLNRCPRYKRTFVCTEGDDIGGCTGSPSDLAVDQCKDCCELTSCRLFDAIPSKPLPAEEIVDTSDNCPPCEASVCKSRVNQCPKSGIAPFLCYDGLSTGGCATRPWKLDGRQCRKCCRVGSGC